jgi:UDP-glucose 4-epimerase
LRAERGDVVVQVLVTGGLGFLGHAVVRQLVDDGHKVSALSSRTDAQSHVPGVDVVNADIRDRRGLAGILADIAPEGICHLAALTRVRDSFADPLTFFDVNVGGTAALLGALQDASSPPVRIVFASTGAVYGPSEGRIGEDAPTLPTNPYGASKLAAEQLLTYHAGTGAIGVITLRAFNIAGAIDGVGDTDTTRIIPKALAVAAGRANKLSLNGDGSAIREFTHVADVASAVALSLDAAQPGKAAIYNVGSGIELTMRQVVESVERVTNTTLPVEHLAPKPEPKILVADSARIRSRLAWTPTRSALDDIVRDGWAVYLSPA